MGTQKLDKWAEQDARQDRVNAVYDEQGPDAAKAMIREIASMSHAQSPQYDGYWDGGDWTVAMARRPLRSKSGTQVDRGDVVLIRRPVAMFSMPWPSATFFSVRLGWNCSCFGTEFRFVGEMS